MSNSLAAIGLMMPMPLGLIRAQGQVRHPHRAVRGRGLGRPVLISLFSGWFTCFMWGGLAAETVQELGLPSPVENEWIFANVTMGRVGATEIEFCLNLLNRTSKTGYVEYAFFLPSGEEPSFTLDGRQRPSAHSIVLTPWRNARYCFNSLRSPLESPEVFVGWAEVKSSAEIVVTARMQTRDGRSGEIIRDVDLFGNPSPIRQARFQLTNNRSGLTVVNPFEEPIDLRLSIGQGSRLDPPDAAIKIGVQEVSLAPRTQRSFLVEDDHAEGGIFLEIELAGEGPGFAYQGLGFFSSVDGGIGLFQPPPYAQGVSRDLIGVEQPSGQWDLPVPLKDSIELGEKWVGITGFGYYIREPSGALSLFLEPGVESLTQDQVHQLAFANHYDGKQLIFPEEERMLALPQVGRVQSVTAIGEDLLEIESERFVDAGLIFLSLCRFALVDPEALKVLQTFSYTPNPISNAGMNCTTTPPWR